MKTISSSILRLHLSLDFLLVYNTQWETMLSNITWRSSGNDILVLISVTLWEDKWFLGWKLNTLRDIYLEISILKTTRLFENWCNVYIGNEKIAFGFIKIFYLSFSIAPFKTYYNDRLKDDNWINWHHEVCLQRKSSSF